jgi:hypothetical protein
MAEFHPPEGLRKVACLAARDWARTHFHQQPDDRMVDAVLAALFEACEVREEWGVRSVVPDRGIPDYWRENRAQAEDTIAARSALGAHVRSSLIHRCALKTPVEVITPPVSSTGEEPTGG